MYFGIHMITDELERKIIIKVKLKSKNLKYNSQWLSLSNIRFWNKGKKLI